MRAQLEKKVVQRDKEKQEDKLRKLAQKAREARAGIQNVSGILRVVFFVHHNTLIFHSEVGLQK